MDLNKELEELKAKVTPMSTGKFIIGTLISLGATAAVVGLFKNPIEGTKGLTKLMMKLGIFVMGCKAGDIAEKYFNETFDETINAFKETHEEMKTA
jgi:hypothetical protein